MTHALIKNAIRMTPKKNQETHSLISEDTRVIEAMVFPPVCVTEPYFRPKAPVNQARTSDAYQDQKTHEGAYVPHTCRSFNLGLISLINRLIRLIDMPRWSNEIQETV